MGTLRHKNGKPVKSKRAGKKPAAAPSRASRKAAPQSGATQELPATKPAEPTPTKRKRGRVTAPPPLSTGAAAAPQNPADHEPTGPALSGAASAVTGERRRWSDRPGPATNTSEAKRSESGDSGETPVRANKLMPTNAVHPTERRIKRRMHKNGALVAAAGAALLGVLILSNQSKPPELVLSDRQIASRLPADQDWQSNTTTPASEAASRTRTPDSDSPRLTAPAPPMVLTNGLSAGDIVEIERMLGRLDLAAGTPDGVIDDDTSQAIRLYQQIAGLPVDGEASPDLLADMREVVKILDSSN